MNMKLRMIRLKTNSGHSYFRYEEINHLTAAGAYTNFYFNSKQEPLRESHSIGYYEEELTEDDFFCRIHESHIVNMLCIDKDEGTTLILKDGTKIPVSRTGREKLSRIFSHHHHPANKQNHAQEKSLL
jgi:two-component system, LytTR family, response regulator